MPIFDASNVVVVFLCAADCGVIVSIWIRFFGLGPDAALGSVIYGASSGLIALLLGGLGCLVCDKAKNRKMWFFRAHVYACVIAFVFVIAYGVYNW